MLRISLIAAFLVSLCVTADASAQHNGPLAARRGPWVVYRYPLFGQSNRPPEARRHSQEYYWPTNVWERYPKFYGGFHSRYFDEIGRPSGDLGLRGYAW